MVKEDYNLVMALAMMELSLIMKYQDMVYTFGQTKEFMKENGWEIKCKEKEFWNSQMDEFIKEYFNPYIIKSYLNDKKHGKGTFYWGDGRWYIGTWENGK